MEMAELKRRHRALGARRRAVDRIDQLVSELLTLAQGSGIDEPTEFALGGVAREAWDTAGSADARPPSSARMPECAATAAGCDRCREPVPETRNGTRPDGQTRFDRPTDSGEDAPLTVLVTATGGDFSSPTTDRGSIRRTARRSSTLASRPARTGQATGSTSSARSSSRTHGWTIGVRRDGTDPACPDDVTVPDGACFVVGGPDSDAADADEPWIDG